MDWKIENHSRCHLFSFVFGSSPCLGSAVEAFPLILHTWDIATALCVQKDCCEVNHWNIGYLNLKILFQKEYPPYSKKSAHPIPKRVPTLHRHGRLLRCHASFWRGAWKIHAWLASLSLEKAVVWTVCADLFIGFFFEKKTKIIKKKWCAKPRNYCAKPRLRALCIFTLISHEKVATRIKCH